MKLLHQFNTVGTYLKTFVSYEEASISTNASSLAIQLAVSQKTRINNAFYFSFDRNFQPPKRKHEKMYGETYVFGEKREIKLEFRNQWGVFNGGCTEVPHPHARKKSNNFR